jgi:glycosyltransferase involved in cell wall biosynthesis
MSCLDTKYVVITAVRDEEEHLRQTIECMLGQTIPPIEWIIVNDGSTDNTPKIIDEYAEKFDWIRAVHRGNRGFRKPGGGVVEAFNDGYSAIRSKDWEFIAKFDGDLSFESDYFEQCFQRFREDRKLGVAGGTICYVSGNHTQIEQAPPFHVRGATKIYRKACWEGIGGLWPAPGWDTIDEIKANAQGWSTRSFNDLLLVHHRPTGEADGRWQALVKYGRANYICGYDPVFMVAKCLRRVVQKPRLVGSAVLMYGYISGYVMRVPQLDDPIAVAYLRRQQWNKLTGRHSIWDKTSDKVPSRRDKHK